MKNLFKTRKNRVIALVLAAMLLFGSVAAGLAVTLAAEPAQPFRLKQPSTTLNVLPSGSPFSVSATGVAGARLTDETMGSFSKAGTNYVFTSNGTKTAGIAQIVRVNNTGGFMLDITLQVADASKITGYDLPNGGNGFVSKVSATPVDLGITYYKSAAAVVPSGQPWAPNESAISNYDSSTSATLANQVEWKSLDPTILEVASDKRTVYARAEGITMLLGEFTDRWGVEQHIHYLFGVGVAPGKSDSDLSKLLDAIKKGEAILGLPDNPYKEDGLGVLQAAVDAAKDLLDNNPNPSNTQINDAATAINNAINGLEQKNTGGEVIIDVPGGGKFKRPYGPKNIYEVLNPDGSGKEPPEYIYDEDGSLEEEPPRLSGDEKPAYKDGYIYYVEEEPEGSNIFYPIDPDTGEKDTANPKWGGADKKPGGGDDRKAAYANGAWYAEDPAGSNVWKPVKTAVGSGQGSLLTTGWVGGGGDGKPSGIDNLYPIIFHDGEYYAGPFGSGDDMYYVGMGDDGRFDTSGYNNTGRPRYDAVHPLDEKLFWDGTGTPGDGGTGEFKPEPPVTPEPPSIGGSGVTGNNVAITLTEGYGAYTHPITVSGTPAPTVSKAGGNGSIGYSSGNITVAAGLTASGSPYTATFTVANSAGSVTITVTVTVNSAAVAPTITTASLPGGTYNVPYSQSLAATGTAPITWTLDGGSLPDGLALSAGVISGTPTAVGTFNFTVKAANSAGNNSKSLSIVIAKANQAALSIASANTHTFGSNYTITSTGGSGTGAVSYSVVAGGTGAGTISGSTLTITTAGTILLKATKAADANYNEQSSAVFTLTVANASQAALTVTDPGVKTYGNAAFQLATTGGSGTGAVTYTLVSGPGTVTSAGSVTITGAGTIVVRATKAADANYNAVTSADRSITVNKASQAALTVSASPNPVNQGSTSALSTSGGSGTGAVTYARTNGTGTATVSGSTLSATTAGTVTVTATKAGDTNYNAITSAAVTVTITAPTPPTPDGDQPANGRKLTATQAGDTSEWIEIATNGGYSLILRVTKLQDSQFRASGNAYAGSQAQNLINAWYYWDVPPTAPIRAKAMQNDVMSKCGTEATFGDRSNSAGRSVPKTTKPPQTESGTKDIAFLLSFQEAALYCSDTWYSTAAGGAQPSTSFAKANWNALGADKGASWWLRSPGQKIESLESVSYVLSNGGIGSSIVSGSYALRPALWVESSIFPQ